MLQAGSDEGWRNYEGKCCRLHVMMWLTAANAAWAAVRIVGGHWRWLLYMDTT